MEKYYTVEQQIAELFRLHPKTPRYIREGRLKVYIRLEKAYVTGQVITENAGLMAEAADISKTEFTSVLRILRSVTTGKGCSFVNLLQHLKRKLKEHGKSTMYAQFLEHENKVELHYGEIFRLQEMVNLSLL